MSNELVERLRTNSVWRNEKWQCITDPELLTKAADEIEQMREALQQIAQTPNAGWMIARTVLDAPREDS